MNLQNQNSLKVFHTIQAESCSLDLDCNGSIIGIRNKYSNAVFSVNAHTSLEGFTLLGTIKTLVQDNSCSFSKTMTNSLGRKCYITESFLPEGDSIRWQLKMQADGDFWSVPIINQIQYNPKKDSRFFTAWSDPDHKNKGWRDPRVLKKFTNQIWSYSNLSHFTPELGDYISIPLATITEELSDSGLSFCLSPEDTILKLHLQTTKNGTILFKRENHRFGNNSTLDASIYIVGHESDWRGGLRFYSSKYSRYFNPPLSKANDMAGCGAYSGFEDKVDAEKLKKMSFRTNWKLSDDFPYMGMFLPPVKSASETWNRSCDEPCPLGKEDTTSCNKMNNYASYMKDKGFYVLNYFNVTEFGKKMNDTPGSEPDDTELWKSPIQFLNKKFPNAVLDTNLKTFYGAKVTDCGDFEYSEFLLDQAERHIELLPDTAGICIDRMDWLRFYNTNADDGISLIHGKPARALTESWKKLLVLLGKKMHDAEKVIFANPMTMRIDLLEHIDGIFSEHGEAGPGLNSIALIALNKPAITWTCMWWVKPIYKLKPNPHSFFQRHLLMGVYPIAPYPYNNHALRPNEATDAFYLLYGPLLDTMRGKKWVLKPHCVESLTKGILVNMFEISGTYSIPVCFGGKKEFAHIQIRNIDGLEKLQSYVVQLGICESKQLEANIENSILTLKVPLKNGCAVVVLK